MEENKEIKKEHKKLSYEELENAARQISVQLDSMAKENHQLKLALQQSSLSNMYTELNFKFKVIEYMKAFSPEFVKMCIDSIEEIMTPTEEKENSNKD